MFGHVYILKNCNVQERNVYKIGRTDRSINCRFGEYGRQSATIFSTQCNNSRAVERRVIHVFKQKFTHRPEYGLEYFEGDIYKMKDMIHTIEQAIRPQICTKSAETSAAHFMLGETFDVDHILGHSGNISRPTKCMFHVKWTDYPHDQNTWEPYTNIKDCIAYKQYVNKHKRDKSCIAVSQK